MTKKAFILLFLAAAAFAVPSFSQQPQSARSGAVLLARAPGPAVGFADTLNQVLNGASAGLKQKNVSVAIRTCSPSVLATSLPLSDGFPLVVAEELRKAGFTPDRILYLRQADDCRTNRRYRTEYWLVPDGAQLPPYLELRRASQISAYLFIGDSFSESGSRITYYGQNRILTEETFEQMLDEAAKQILRDSSSLFIVVGDLKGGAAAKNAKRIVAGLIKRGVAPFRILERAAVSSAGAKYPQSWLVSQ